MVLPLWLRHTPKRKLSCNRYLHVNVCLVKWCGYTSTASPATLVYTDGSPVCVNFNQSFPQFFTVLFDCIKKGLFCLRYFSEIVGIGIWVRLFESEFNGCCTQSSRKNNFLHWSKPDALDKHITIGLELNQNSGVWCHDLWRDFINTETATSL